MKMPSALSSIPERAWLFVFAGIFLLGGIGTFFLYTDTRLLEQKIVSKQKEVSSVLQLKETYETRKRDTREEPPED